MGDIRVLRLVFVTHVILLLLITGENTDFTYVGAQKTVQHIAEIVLTTIFVLVVLGTTDSKVGAGNFAGLAIGLSLVLIHLVGIHYTGTSVNPARSFGPAIFEGGQAISDLWVFLVGPFVGSGFAAGIWTIIAPGEDD